MFTATWPKSVRQLAGTMLRTAKTRQVFIGTLPLPLPLTLALTLTLTLNPNPNPNPNRCPSWHSLPRPRPSVSRTSRSY